MDVKEILKRQVETSQEILEELKTSKSPRVEILLATNYAELILKDFMEFLLQTEEAREIPRQIIVDILENKGLIPKDLAYDVRQIFKIRDAYAHKPSLRQANEFAEKEVLPNLNCVKEKTPKVENWEQRSLNQKIIDCSEWIFVNLRWYFEEIAGTI